MCFVHHAGIAALLKSVSPDIHVVGCQPAASDVMLQSVVAGRIVDVPSEDTLSDGRRVLVQSLPCSHSAFVPYNTGCHHPVMLMLVPCSCCAEDAPSTLCFTH